MTTSDNGFATLGLRDEFMRALADLNYSAPTPIQEKVIPLLLTQHASDVIALAQTGTGKTAAFGLPLLSDIDFTNKKTQALVICPTRELCLQIVENLTAFSKYLSSVSLVAVYGGSPIGRQITQLRAGASVIVATPGRLKDLMERRVVDLSQVQTVVLDEADEMLNMGFREEIYTIFSTMPQPKNVWLFSATMMPDIKILTKKIMSSKPQEVSVAAVNTTNKNIVHKYYLVRAEHKYESLKRLLHTIGDFHAIIFCRTKSDTQTLTRKLKTDGFEVDYLNGDMAQNEREAIMYKYKNHLVNILVATDVAARGIDVSDITHVVNYELPDDPEAYTHRSGRTARAGKTGHCYSLVIPKDAYRIRRIEQYIKDKIEREDIPTPKAVIDALLHATIAQIHVLAVGQNFGLDNYLPEITEAIKQYSAEDLAKIFIAHTLGNKIVEYGTQKDINVSELPRSYASEGRGQSTGRGQYARRAAGVSSMLVNIGRKDGWDKSAFLTWVRKNAPSLPSRAIGRINLRDTITFFDVPDSQVEMLLRDLSNKTMKGRKIRVALADN